MNDAGAREYPGNNDAFPSVDAGLTTLKSLQPALAEDPMKSARQPPAAIVASDKNLIRTGVVFMLVILVEVIDLTDGGIFGHY
jgi:hypothetical protein